MKDHTLSLSIVIPTFNNEVDLPTCLASIKKQDYNQKKIEILVCDGGSTDKTKEIAKKYGCQILENKKKLAEYGVALGFHHAYGDVITILAADNELENKDFIKNIIFPFIENKNVMLAYPIQKAGKTDSWIANYISTFTDPINHFVYGNASNTRTFHKEYPIKEKNKSYILYAFSLRDYPMIAFAQGTTVRGSYKRKKKSHGDDIAPILNMIEKNFDLAYVPKAKLIHHTTRSLSEFIRKQRWAIDNYLLRKNYGVAIRQNVFSQKRKLRTLLWPLYIILIFPPIIVSLKGLVEDKEKAWLYHPFLSYVTFLLLVFEYIRVRIFKINTVTERKKV